MTHNPAPTQLHVGSIPQVAAIGDDAGSAWTDYPPPSVADDPIVGTVLNRTYRVTGILGEGGMGRVYEAWHTRIAKKRFALKVLHPEFVRDPEILRRFEREAEAAATVGHPNAVGVYDVALTPQGWPFIVCEYLEGIDLAQHIKSVGPLSPATAKHIVLQVCAALCEAHRQGVIHRDLKPQNVFLVGNFALGVPELPDAKVLDFGLSRFLDGSDSELTRTGMIMGTPSYMAPEQAQGIRADHRVDVYGVGTILYAVLTGRPPFRADTPQATLLSVLTEEAPRPTSLNPAVTDSMEFVVQRAMAKLPEQRYPDMATLRDAISALSVDSSQRHSEVASRRALRSEMDSSPNVRSARTRLAALIGVTSVLAIAGFVTASVSLVTALRGNWPFTRIEGGLLLLALVGTLLTPAILLFLSIRKSIWGNTARVVEWIERLARSVRLGLGTYGAGALALLFYDSVLLRLLPPVLGSQPLSQRWPVLGVSLFLAACSRVGASLASEHFAAREGFGPGATKAWKRWLPGPVLDIGGFVAVLGWLALAALWPVPSSGRASATLEEGAALSGGNALEVAVSASAHAAAANALSGAESNAQAAAVASLEPPASSAAPEVSAAVTPVLALATDEELTAAISQGATGLQELLDRFPSDPKVLRAAAVAFASRAATLERAVLVFERLFSVSPATVAETDLQNMVSRMATANGEVGDRAFRLMSHKMGSSGPDLLYHIALARPQQREVALRHLAQPAVRQLFSPQLAVAYDLHFATSCSARLGLLSRAEQLGDERSILVLQPLASGSDRGCGKRKREPCKAPCAKEASAFRKTIEVIATRLRRGNAAQ